jgi:SOS response regulatory protein OraA/RecX
MLQRLKVVDDLDFSIRWAESRIKHNPKSPWLIARELREKGVPVETVEKAVGEALGEVDLEDLTRQVLRRRYAGRTYAASDRDRLTKRMVDFLLRRGFGPQLALEVSRQVASECINRGNSPV